MIQNKEIFIKNPFSTHISIDLIDYSIFKLQNSIIFDDLSYIYLFIPFFPKISREKQGRNKGLLNSAWGRIKEFWPKYLSLILKSMKSKKNNLLCDDFFYNNCIKICTVLDKMSRNKKIAFGMSDLTLLTDPLVTLVTLRGVCFRASKPNSFQKIES